MRKHSVVAPPLDRSQLTKQLTDFVKNHENRASQPSPPVSAPTTPKNSSLHQTSRRSSVRRRSSAAATAANDDDKRPASLPAGAHQSFLTATDTSPSGAVAPLKGPVAAPAAAAATPRARASARRGSLRRGPPAVNANVTAIAAAPAPAAAAAAPSSTATATPASAAGDPSMPRAPLGAPRDFYERVLQEGDSGVAQATPQWKEHLIDRARRRSTIKGRPGLLVPSPGSSPAPQRQKAEAPPPPAKAKPPAMPLTKPPRPSPRLRSHGATPRGNSIGRRCEAKRRELYHYRDRLSELALVAQFQCEEETTLAMRMAELEEQRRSNARALASIVGEGGGGGPLSRGEQDAQSTAGAWRARGRRREDERAPQGPD